MSSAKPTPDAPDGFLSRWSRRKVQARDGQAQTEPPSPTSTAATALPAALPAAQGPAAAGAAPTPAAPDAARLTPTPAPSAAQAQGAPAGPAAAPPPAPPAPTMEDVARLTQDSDYSRFVGRGVDPGVKNAALHKLFADPHFNVMDGLDIYIDDYGRPDPLPAGMLEKMVQSEALGLFTKTPEPADTPSDAPSDTALHPASEASAAVPADTSTDTPADPPRPLSETRAHEDPDLRLQPHDAAGTAEPPGPGGHGTAGPEQDPGRQR
jgi:hypothetical protein